MCMTINTQIADLRSCLSYECMMKFKPQAPSTIGLCGTPCKYSSEQYKVISCRHYSFTTISTTAPLIVTLLLVVYTCNFKFITTTFLRSHICICWLFLVVTSFTLYMYVYTVHHCYTGVHTCSLQKQIPWVAMPPGTAQIFHTLLRKSFIHLIWRCNINT